MTPSPKALAPEEAADLRASHSRLAEEKSTLQLILQLMERLDPTPELDELMRTLPVSLGAAIGGTDIKLYCWVDGELRCRSLAGDRLATAGIDDEAVAHVARTRQPLEQPGQPGDTLLVGAAIEGAFTWTYPLLAGGELVGIVKLENLHLSIGTLGRYLPMYFRHAALLIANAIRRDRRARAERRLKESERELRTTIDAIPGCIAQIGPDARYRRVNAGYAQLVGREPRDIIGQHVEAVIGPQEWLTLAPHFRRALAGERVDNESVARYAGGGERWVRRSLTPEWDREGRIRGIIALVQDVTEQHRAAEQLRRLSRVVQQTPVSVVITDRAGAIEYVNPYFETITGYSAEEVVGHNPRVLKSGMTHPEVYRGLWRALEAHGEWRGEFCNRRKDGSLYWESATIFPLLGDDDAVTHYVAVKVDLTERRQLEEARLRSQKLESLGTLAGGIAHDFNNILAAIRGNVELAVEELGEGHPVQQSLAEVQRAGARAAELVRRITAFAAPAQPGRSAQDLAPVVDEVLKLLRPTLPAAISLQTRAGEGVPAVNADTAQVHEVLVNLTTNAAYAIGPRAGTIEYVLAAAHVGAEEAGRLRIAPGGYARLTVRDSGCGMDEGTLARIFDAFYTTKPLGEGSGLGLSMVYGIVRGHGGAVDVESTPGCGSSFHLYFPAAGGQPDAQAPLPPGPAAARRPLRVMYVDDEEPLVSLAQRALGRLGHRVSGFCDPGQALAAFQERPHDFDVVVTDLSMPHLSGFELARGVFEARADVAVVMMSGYVRAEDESRASDMGILALLPKPVPVFELADTLERLVGGAVAAAPESGKAEG